MGIFLVLRPEIWHNKIESNFNKMFLSDNDWHLSIGNMDGHLLTTVIMKDVLLEHKEGSIVMAKSIRSKVNLLPLVFGIISFS